MFNSLKEVPLFGRKEKRIKGNSLGHDLSTQACFSCRCQHKMALDPDIKEPRETFHLLRIELMCLHTAFITFAASLPILSRNYAQIKHLRPLVDSCAYQPFWF